MSKLKKILATSLMVFVSCFTFLGTAISNVARTIFSFGSANASTMKGNKNETEPGKDATSVKKGHILTVPSIKKTANKFEDLELPYLDGTSAVKVSSVAGETSTKSAVKENLFVKITGPNGDLTESGAEGTVIKKFADGEDTPQPTTEVRIEGNKLYLNPQSDGEYRVQYFYKESNVWTSSVEHSIFVSSISHKMTMPKNNEIVMPSVVSSKEGKNDTKIALPVIYDENGKVVNRIGLGDTIQIGGQNYHDVLVYKTIENTTLGKVSPVQLKAENVYEKYETYTIERVEDEASTEEYKLDIAISSAKPYTTVKAESNDGAPESEAPEFLRVAGEETSFEADTTYQAKALTFKVAPGKNIIEYTLRKGVGADKKVLTRTFITVEGSETVDVDKMNLVATPSSTIRSSTTQRGKKTYLPKIAAVDKNKNRESVDVFYYYTIKARTSTGDYTTNQESIVMGKDANGVYFIPKGESPTTYEIYYNVVDKYGHKAENDENYDYEITVTDSVIDTVEYVKSYNPFAEDIDKNENNKEFHQDYVYAVKNKILIGDTLEIPAIFAKDQGSINNIAAMSRTIEGTNFIGKDDKKVSDGYITINNDKGKTTSSFTTKEGVKLFAEGVTDYDSSIVSFADAEYNANFKVVKNEFSSQLGEATAFTKLEEGTQLARAKASQIAKIKISADVFGAGTYTINFSIRDNESVLKTFSINFTVVEGEDELNVYKDPKVEFEQDETFTIGKVKADQQVYVPVPTIVDEVDKNLLVKYYVVSGDKFFPVELDETGKYITFNTNQTEIYAFGGSTENEQSIFELAQASDNKMFEVRAYAFNDRADYNLDLSATSSFEGKYVGMDYYRVSVAVEADTEAPTITDLTALNNALNEKPVQGSDFVVKGITFHDNSNSARVICSVVDTEGREYDYDEMGVTEISGTTGDYTYKFPGIKFHVSNADSGNYYTVTYTLLDEANNAVSYSFVLVHATDKTGPTLDLNGIKPNYTLELGQRLNLDKITAKDNYTPSKDIKITLEACELEQNNIKKSKFSCYNSITKFFEPDEVGVYTLKIKAVDGNLNSSSENDVNNTIVVKVEDTKAPTMSFVEDESGKAIKTDKNFYEDQIKKDPDTKKETFPTIYLPYVSATDSPQSKVSDDNKEVVSYGVSLPGMFKATRTLTIKAPKAKYDTSTKVEYKFNLDDSLDEALANEKMNKIGLVNNKASQNYSFTPTLRGHYTVIYSAVDAAGNKAEDKVIEIYVGDTTKPTVVVNEGLSKKLANGFVLGDNDTLVINPRAGVYGKDKYDSTDMYVKDDYEFNTEKDGNFEYKTVTITIKDANGNIVDPVKNTDENNHLVTYKFEKAGNYTMIIETRDALDYLGSETKTFTVKAKPSNTVDSSTILGTVLIVISVVVLVGVIIYFVKGTKLLPKKNKNAKKNKKDDKTEKKD